MLWYLSWHLLRNFGRLGIVLSFRKVWNPPSNPRWKAPLPDRACIHIDASVVGRPAGFSALAKDHFGGGHGLATFHGRCELVVD
ncbi:hypothetical protein TIFTF001_029163 [Ficus carica]|uniref:Uncharacterized protein n=1 Tax=Ficus carica TaxID=3494 RepID=A0AA88DRB8_FICCA|nr:hypothetical protein TIFTF001_029163 [Ficus carica]